MARTRAQRRRRTLIIALALAVTLVVLLFARDVSRAAHGSITSRRSENRSFAALADGLIEQQNLFDTHLASLLADGGSLSRPVFAARLTQLDEQLSSWSDEAGLILSPRLAHDVNTELADLTDQRVAAYRQLFYDLDRELSLPGASKPSVTVAEPSSTLFATSNEWNLDRFALVKEPGAVHLSALSAQSARFVLNGGLATLLKAPSLRLVRAISIAAIRVDPAPLPAATGVLLLPPVTSFHLGVSVLNASYDLQPVSLSVSLTPLNGLGQPFSATMRATLSPLGAYGFSLDQIATVASERARLVVVVTGARAAKGHLTREVFEVETSPSGGTGDTSGT